MDILNAKGKPLRSSASAVETWLDCKRKWAYSYYWRVERVSSPAAETGNKVHDVLEHWLKTGEKPEDPNNRYWRIAEPGLQFLPEVRSDGVSGNWQVEEWVECKCGPLPFVGKIDLYNLEDFANIQIDDHKTTGDSSWRWAKTPNQLAKLIQPHAYAWSLIQVHGLTPPESVDFRHIYYATKGPPKAMEVRAPGVPWPSIEETWRKLEIIAEKMAETALRIVKPEEVEATTSSCKKFGGCPYNDRCAASPLNRDKIKPTTITIKREPEMNERLTALRAQLLNKPKVPALKPEPKRERKPVEDPQGDAYGLGLKLHEILEGGTAIPITAAEAMAKSADVYLHDAMEAVQLKNTGGFLVRKDGEPQVPPTNTDEQPTDLELFTVSRGEGAAEVLTQWNEYLERNSNRMSRKNAQAIVRDATGAQRVRKERLLHYIEQFNEAYVNKTIILQGNVMTLRQRICADGPRAEGKVEVGIGKTMKNLILPAKDSEVVRVSRPHSPASESNALPPKPEDTPLGRIVKEVATPTIYIDCIPEDPAGVYSFTDFIRPFEMVVEEEGGMVDKKFMQPLPYYGLIDFGKGPGKVAGKVLAALHRSGADDPTAEPIR